MNIPRKTSTIFPDSQKPTYGNGIENIDFTIKLSDGQALLNNSVRLTGNVAFYKAGLDEPFEVTDGLAFYDNKMGVHSLFRSVYINTDQGTLSNINDYPTWVRLFRQRDSDLNGYCGSALRELELCMPSVRHTNAIISRDEGTNFSMYPLMALNLADPDSGNMTNRAGAIRLTFATNNPLSVLFGADTSDVTSTATEYEVDIVPNPVTSSAGYLITDLKLHYDVVEAMPMDTSTTMMSVFSARHTVLSNNDTFSVNLPLVATAFVGAYKPLANMNNAGTNEYAFQNPDISRLEFTYNNNTNEIISFPLKTQEEIILNSMNALEVVNKTSVTLGQITKNTYGDEFSIGLNFGEPLDMKQARFSIRTECNNISNINRSFLDVFAVGSVTA